MAVIKEARQRQCEEAKNARLCVYVCVCFGFCKGGRLGLHQMDRSSRPMTMGVR